VGTHGYRLHLTIFLDQQGPHPQLHFIEKKPSSYREAKTAEPKLRERKNENGFAGENDCHPSQL
jgi:hypothetical protein